MPVPANERFLARAAALGVDVRPRRFPDGTRTAAEAAAAVGCDVAQIVKSLVFIADGVPILALTSGSNRVDEDKLAVALGATEVRKADAEPPQVRRILHDATIARELPGHPHADHLKMRRL